MKLIDKNKLLEELKKLKQNLSASPIVVIEDVESLVESLEVKEVEQEKKKVLKKAVEWIDYGNKNGGCLFDGWERSFIKYLEK